MPMPSRKSPPAIPVAFRRSLLEALRRSDRHPACILYTLLLLVVLLGRRRAEQANWRLAGAYLADWVSYEIRPDIEFKDGHLTIDYSRFSELGANPNPEWVVKQMATIERQVEAAPAPAIATNKPSHGIVHGAWCANCRKPGRRRRANRLRQRLKPCAKTPSSEATVDLGNGEIVVTPSLVTVTRGAESVVFDIAKGGSVTPRTPLPDWIEQRKPGSTAYVSFGFSGRAEVQSDEVVVWNVSSAGPISCSTRTRHSGESPFGEVALTDRLRGRASIRRSQTRRSPGTTF